MNISFPQFTPRRLPMDITVYTLPACVQCETTKRYLDKQGVNYTVVDISTSEDAHKRVTDLGYSQAPVVSVNNGDQHWSGFRLDKLQYVSYSVHNPEKISA